MSEVLSLQSTNLRLCSIGDCGRAHLARGFCARHYLRARSAGEFTDSLIHNLRDIDGNSAVCAICGPVTVELRTRGPICGTKAEELREASRQRRRRKREDPEYRARENRYHAEYNRRRAHNLPPGGLEVLLELAGGACQICQRPITVPTMHVDHDHSCCPKGSRSGCGKCVRGVLCRRCNTGIGVFEDDPSLLISAVDYLRTLDPAED